MDKNSIIGFALIGLILFGFTFFQSKQSRKQMELQAALDSAARVEALQQMASIDTAAAQQTALQQVSDPMVESASAGQSIYKDTLLDRAHSAEESFVTLSNDLLELTFTTKGAQPYSAMVKDYYNYDSTALYIFNPGKSEYAVSIYTTEFLKTTDFVFDLAEKTDSSLVFRLPLACGGYIEQKYVLPADSYMTQNTLSFIGMENSIPKNVSMIDIDYSMTLPRMEKGYKNESQYSKLDYYFNGEKKPVEIGRGRNSSKRIDSRLSWFAYQQQFFSAIMRSKQEFASGELAVSFFPQEDPDRNLMACSAKMREELVKTNPSSISLEFEFYFGPNNFRGLKSFGQKYEKIIPLGGSLVGWFTKYAIIPMFDFFHRFIDNFGLIILLMTLVIKFVVLPFTYKSYSSSAKMQALKPEIEKINAKYPKQEDAMKKQQATMELYKKAGASPMGGCLPTLLTFPILWAMFRFFPASIELRQQPFLWCKDLSTYDSIVDFGARVPLIGDHLSLFALLMAVVMWFYGKMTTANQPVAENDPSASSMKFMSVWMMPIMMFFICNSLSAALSYYYLLSQLVSMVQIWFIKKYMVHPEKVLEKVKAAEGKPVQKSKWQLRLEEAQRMQEQQMKAQQKNRR